MSSGELVCLAVDSTLSKVDQDTYRLEGCKVKYGPSATLAAFPTNEPALWDLVNDMLLPWVSQ